MPTPGLPRPSMTSRIPGFHDLGVADRAREVQAFADLGDDQRKLLAAGLDPADADALVENAVGSFGLPLGVATNFTVNGTDRLVPMAVEESSVVAAASHGAKMAREHGGFDADVTDPVMTGQVHLVEVEDPAGGAARIRDHEEELMERADDAAGSLPERGGGARGLTVRPLETREGPALAVGIHVDVRDAMGANAVTAVAEALAGRLAELGGGRPLLRILTNRPARRRVEVHGVFDGEQLGGEDVVDDVVRAQAIAEADPDRATTHNKGIMNGIDAVAVATGNDWRAVEAGAHGWAARGGYGPLTRYQKTEDGHLEGWLEAPLALGTVGGVTGSHPLAQVNLQVLDVDSAQELAAVAGAVGLAQNAAALRALVDEGITAGHMRLHARNLALEAGVPRDRAGDVAQRMVEQDRIGVRHASAIWESLTGE